MNSTPSDSSSAASLWSDAALISTALIWGINIPIMKIGLEQLDAYVFNAVRLSVAALVLVGFAIHERRRGLLPKSAIRPTGLLVYAVLASALYQLLFLLGISRTTSGNTALIITTVPLWTAVLARVFKREILRPWAWCGLCIAFLGTVVVAFQKGDVTASRDHQLGNLLMLGAALLWSAATVYSRSLLTMISPVQLSASAAVIALPFHLLYAVGHYEASLPALSSRSLWLVILYSGVLSTGLALPLWNFGVRHAGAAHAAIAQNLIPLTAIVAAWISRGESVTVAQLTGGALILTGLVIMRAARPTAEIQPEPAE